MIATTVLLLWQALALPASFAADPVIAVNLKLDPKTGTTEFHATGHPSAIKIVGKGAAPTGAFKVEGLKVTGTATFDLTSLDTGIEMRNQHMKEKYLETGKFPTCTLTVSDMALPKTLDDGGSLSAVPFTGKLSLHGVEHAVSGTCDLAKKNGAVSFDATFEIKVDDYKIDQPKFAGITMADTVQVSVHGSAM